LETVDFFPPLAPWCRRVLGVLISRAPQDGEMSFSVPAHVMLTLNHVQGGSLSLDDQRLPASFATGPQIRSRRYRISAGALLITLFCRADAIHDLCGRPVKASTGLWSAPCEVFVAWVEPSPADSAAQVAQAMLECVAPQILAPLSEQATRRPGPSIGMVLRTLANLDLPQAAVSLAMSERGLQRFFLTHFGVSPKRVQRMLRIQRCVELWGSNATQVLGLADLAAQVGLADQAHLAREFRELVGYPPGALKRPGRSSGAELEDTLWALRTGNSLLTPLLLQD
jgi:AraC-like DNA-binding protein